MSEQAARLQPGAKVAGHITVVGAIDAGGRDPVYIVWNHLSWCAMCCKLFKRPSQARWEARALRRLAHPGIVRLLEDGAPNYVLTEFLEGPTLRKLLKSSPDRRLSVSDALRTAIHLGSALAHMHARRLLHLDVKPANVIIAARRPVLFDLGTARRDDGGKLSSPQGTDAYMAPEQCRARRPRPASDIYGLGVTLYEMLAGTHPFPEGDAAEPFPQLHLVPTSLHAHLPDAPPELGSLLSACLAPRPKDRPQSMAHLLPALHALIDVGPRMWPEWIHERAARPIERPA